MNNGKKSFQIPVVGGSSLLVIFAVLCLTVFALLGLSIAQMHKQLSDRNTQAITDYYAADRQAEEILAELRSGRLPESVQAEGDLFSYSCPVSDTQELQVLAQRSGDSWKKLKWQLVSTVQSSWDTSQTLWDGEDFSNHN